MHKGRKHKFCTCQNEIIPLSNTNNGFTLRHLQSEASVLQRTLLLCLNAILVKEATVGKYGWKFLSNPNASVSYHFKANHYLKGSSGMQDKIFGALKH
jgi:hypothetical protein